MIMMKQLEVHQMRAQKNKTRKYSFGFLQHLEPKIMSIFPVTAKVFHGDNEINGKLEAKFMFELFLWNVWSPGHPDEETSKKISRWYVINCDGSIIFGFV